MLASVLAATVLLQAPASPTTERAVILPVRSATSSPEVRAALPGIERALADALGRHASFHVISRSEVAAMVGRAAQAQLEGCDAESCVAEIADALGADLSVVTVLDVTPGLWSLQTSLIQRKTASLVRRAGVKARSLDALMASLDVVGRQLAQGSRVSADDPRLAQRLGTDAATADALRARLHEQPDVDLSETWTDLVIERNRESDVLAALQGALLTVGGLGMCLAGGVQGMTACVYTYSTVLPGNVEAVGLPLYTGTAFVLLPAPCWISALATLPMALVVAAVDAADRGRLPVSRDGCCRDEERIREAEAPGWGRRLAPVLATAGGLLALLTPVVFVVTWLGPLAYDYATVSLAKEGFGQEASTLHEAGWTLPEEYLFNDAPIAPSGVVPLTHLGLLGATVLLPFVVVALTAAVLLMLTDTVPLVDEPPPRQVSPGASATTGARPAGSAPTENAAPAPPAP
ncbi:MAG: hypothetical protein AB2A00_41555 [Myxococcota bacterium]